MTIMIARRCVIVVVAVVVVMVVGMSMMQISCGIIQNRLVGRSRMHNEGLIISDIVEVDTHGVQIIFGVSKRSAAFIIDRLVTTISSILGR